MSLIAIFLIPTAMATSGVREVSGTSCDVIKINLGLGMTSEIVLEQEPKVTLFADKKHYKITSNAASPRSLAIIPFVETSELNLFQDSKGRLPSPEALAALLNKSFKTNLFVIFENNNQLMFDLRFVEKEKADYVVKVKQVFKDGCAL